MNDEKNDEKDEKGKRKSVKGRRDRKEMVRKKRTRSFCFFRDEQSTKYTMFINSAINVVFSKCVFCFLWLCCRRIRKKIAGDSVLPELRDKFVVGLIELVFFLPVLA